MELRSSPLWNEIEAIAFNQKITSQLYSYKADFKLDSRKRTYTAFKVLSIEVFGEYLGAYANEIILEVMFPAGDFFYDIYPNRRNIEVLLRREGASREVDIAIGSPIEGQTFIGTLMGDYSAAVESSTVAATTKEALNLTEIVTVKFQLLNKALKDIRLRSVGGVFRNSTLGETIKYVLTTVSKGLELDEDNAIKGVEMVDPHNTDSYEHIVLPHGTPFQDFAKYLSKKVGNIYNSGLSMFLQGRHWYVFPPFDITRFDKSKRTLTLINLPPNQLPNAEITYRTTANQVIALVTGEVKHVDRTESTLQNEGNGVRYADARRIIEGFSTTGQGDNKATVMRAENNNEFITDERNDGMNHVAFSEARITANKFGELSRLARRAGTEILCIWENSNMDLLYPGMPVKFMYLKDDRIRELKGVLIGHQHYVQTYGVGVTDTRHRTDTTLHLFVSREPEN